MIGTKSEQAAAPQPAPSNHEADITRLYGCHWDDTAPAGAEDFAHQAILSICGAGVSAGVAQRAYARCRRALALGATVRIGFRYPGKADAIDRIWRERAQLYRGYKAAPDKFAYLDTLPWIGPATRRRLADRLGLFAERTDRPAGDPAKAAAA